MPHSIFGWSYPPGCSGPPDDDYREPPIYQCGNCGGFLAHKPDRSEPWEDAVECDGTVFDLEGGTVSACGQDKPHAPHRYVLAGGHFEYRRCKKCGAENRETI